MKREHDLNTLIHAVISGQDFDFCRKRSLELMLDAARSRRRGRQVVRAACCFLIPALLLLIAWILPRHRAKPELANIPAQVAPPFPPAATPPPAQGELTILTDSELLELLKDRPVALIGPPGRQRLILLDELPPIGSL